ncbi:MAG: NirA family protein [Acidobacteriaceae bacterium]
MVASQETADFTPEQKQYLQGFLTAAQQRGWTPFAGQLADGRITNERAPGVQNLAEEVEPLFFGTPVSDLCREELWKYEQNGLDVWEKLLAHASENRAPAPDDLFRFKFHGLFYVAPAQDSFMLRLRAPGGVLTTAQMRGLAEMAEDSGAGRCDLTTRANVQIRNFQPRDIVRVLNKVQSLGMTSRGSGADNIRNITASPLSGLDPTELLDVQPLVSALQHFISNSRDLYGLPRKFNVAFDSGGAISVLADTNDIGFVAVHIGEDKEIPAGVYFRVLLCGITGHRQFANDCGLLLRPDQAVAVAVAMIRVFNEHGDRTDRKKARLKYLVDKWGLDKFVKETETLLTFPLLRVSQEECEPRRAINRSGHIGIHKQRQEGLFAIGVVVPVGRLPVAQMRALSEIADTFGSGEFRLTVWQNLIVPNVREKDLEAAQQALTSADLQCTAGPALSGTVACTGNQGCRFAASDTKSHAVALANSLDQHFRIEGPINLHVTGCNNSCAQHYIGDIGLMGVKVGGEEGYQVMLGGGADQSQGLARELIPAIRFSELTPTMHRLFAVYRDRCATDESFLSFTRRHSIEELRQFSGVEVAR